MKFELLFLLSSWSLVLANNSTCPPWTTAADNGMCQCGSSLKGLVKCSRNADHEGVNLTNCFCMTLIKNENGRSVEVVGECLYTCKLHQLPFSTLLNSTEDLDSKICGPFKRTGVFCGDCIEDYGLPVYSYNLSCVKCIDYKYNWLKYIAVAYIPLTLFYFIVIIFRVSATSGLLIGYVTVCQMITLQDFTSWMLFNFENASTSWVLKGAKFSITVAAIWNLDFFRSLYNPFCLHPKLSTLHLFMLDYTLALYPLILILLTYVAVKLHDQYRLVVWLCKPLYACFHHFKKEWNIKNSLIGAFATFYLLSCVKVLYITATFFTPEYLIYKNGTQDIVFYFNASQHYFDKEHSPYIILAIIVFILNVVFPLLLLFCYPCHCFHKFINRVSYRGQTLHIFMDAIFGSYSYKPRERRYFATLYIIIRVLHLLKFSLLNLIPYLSATSYIMIVAIVLVAIFQPYRNKWHNINDVILFSAVLHCYLMLIFYDDAKVFDPYTNHRIRNDVYLSSTYILAMVIPLYGCITLIAVTLPWKSIGQGITKSFLNCLHFKLVRLTDSLPYRMEHDEITTLLV